MHNCIYCGIELIGEVNWSLSLKRNSSYKCKKCNVLAATIHAIRYKELLLELYGPRCACCGEENTAFLTLEHVHNNGADERRKLSAKGNGAIIRDIVRGKRRKEDYTMLCYNCNCAKAIYGTCPHQWETEDIRL